MTYEQYVAAVKKSLHVEHGLTALEADQAAAQNRAALRSAFAGRLGAPVKSPATMALWLLA